MNDPAFAIAAARERKPPEKGNDAAASVSQELGLKAARASYSRIANFRLYSNER